MGTSKSPPLLKSTSAATDTFVTTSQDFAATSEATSPALSTQTPKLYAVVGGAVGGVLAALVFVVAVGVVVVMVLVRYRRHKCAHSKAIRGNTLHQEGIP